MKYYWCVCGNDTFVSRTIYSSFIKFSVCSKCGLVYDFHTKEVYSSIAVKVPMPEEANKEEPTN